MPEIDPTQTTPLQAAVMIDAAMQALPQRSTSPMRRLRREFSRQLKDASPAFMYALALALMQHTPHRWIAYELLRAHKAAFASLGESELEALGQGIDSWQDVDSFGRTLTGPAWLKGQISDQVVQRWAGSPDFWWRRLALVSTVALNMRSQGGYGDAPRTLAICRLLAQDPTDMVVKALSWALRELVIHDPAAVRGFLAEYGDRLAGRVRREVRHKLETGLKNPRR